MDIACAALNGLKMGDRTLTVRRASARWIRSHCTCICLFYTVVIHCSLLAALVSFLYYYPLNIFWTQGRCLCWHTYSFMGFSGQPKPDQGNVLVQAQQQIALQVSYICLLLLPMNVCSWFYNHSIINNSLLSRNMRITHDMSRLSF